LNYICKALTEVFVSP